jgi:hypothetical protein
MNQAEARAQFWSQGVIAPWYLRRSQLDVYELLLREKFPFIESARRFGKTTTILAFVTEKLIQNPGWICRWCFPDKNTVREVMAAEIPKLQRDMPEGYRYEYQTVDSVWKIGNGSGLYIRGVNHDRGDSARGPGANIIVCDEYGFWKEPAYIVKEALFPQLENQEGQWLIKTSTPPENLGHVYYKEKAEAERKNRFIQKIIYDNEALSKEELAIIIEESGGIDSPAFRRERLCEPVSDPDMLIIPEWSKNPQVVPTDYPRPEFFDAYMGGDSGQDDNTFLLFGYYDFPKDEVVIEREFVTNNETTENIINHAKAIEQEIWDKEPYRRVYDADKQLTYDITAGHKYTVHRPEKTDRVAAINSLRARVSAGKFKVKECCTQLIEQLRVGLWADEKHKDFERTEGLGHLDGIAAAIYFNRSVNTKRNPAPAYPGVNPETHFISSHALKQSSSNELKAFAESFRRKRSW